MLCFQSVLVFGTSGVFIQRQIIGYVFLNVYKRFFLENSCHVYLRFQPFFILFERCYMHDIDDD